jgi:ketopantoate reductase
MERRIVIIGAGAIGSIHLAAEAIRVGFTPSPDHLAPIAKLLPR